MPQDFISSDYGSQIKPLILYSANWSVSILDKSQRAFIATDLSEVTGSTGQMVSTCGMTSGSDNPTRDRGVCIDVAKHPL
jgi:hypothetical protein